MSQRQQTDMSCEPTTEHDVSYSHRHHNNGSIIPLYIVYLLGGLGAVGRISYCQIQNNIVPVI